MCLVVVIYCIYYIVLRVNVVHIVDSSYGMQEVDRDHADVQPAMYILFYNRFVVMNPVTLL